MSGCEGSLDERGDVMAIQTDDAVWDAFIRIEADDGSYTRMPIEYLYKLFVEHMQEEKSFE